MLNSRQRGVLFWLFCGVAVASVVAELFVVYVILTKGIDVPVGLATFISTSVLIGVGAVFRDVVKKQFLDATPVSVQRLNQFASEHGRLAISAAGDDLYDQRRLIITHTLRFAESCLQGWRPGSHFELCVFVDASAPLMVAYYDSGGQETARTMQRRLNNPAFYRTEGYEAVRVLDDPRSQPRVIPDMAKWPGYSFNSDEQKRQLRSGVLLSLDLSVASCLVISSNAPAAFPESDSDTMAFLRFVAATVRYDLFRDAFVERVRDLRPDMFRTPQA